MNPTELESLRARGIDVHIGHRAENVEGVAVVVTSTAIKPGNPERDHALAKRIPVVRRAEMLAELMRHPGRVMTRTMLLERVWDFDFDPKTNIVETHLSRLRSKLNAGFDSDLIETVRGAGYLIRDAT